jgi:virginiamycin A acetyltransferase
MQLNFFSKNFKDDVTSKGDVIIEEDVWIGSNSVILSGVNVGRGAVIAAGSIVNKDIPPYAIVGGVPAKIIKMRFTESQIKHMERIKWWEWDDIKIAENNRFFETEV